VQFTPLARPLRAGEGLGVRAGASLVRNGPCNRLHISGLILDVEAHDVEAGCPELLFTRFVLRLAELPIAAGGEGCREIVVI